MKTGGTWREEYERNWRGFTTRALADSFGAQYDALEATEYDRAYLAELLQSMGIRDHTAPKPPTYARKSVSAAAHRPASSSYQDTQLFDDLVSDDEVSGVSIGGANDSFRTVFNSSSMSDASYVYKTPQKQRRASSGHFFPQFSTQDFLPEDYARRESASQTLRIRMADVSPIAPMHESATYHHKQHHQECTTGDGGGDGAGVNSKDGSFNWHKSSSPEAEASCSTPHTGSPSVSDSPDAALLRSGDEAFLTPRPSANRFQQRRRTHSGAARDRPPSALHELSVNESRVYDLDVSMQSMNLSDDGFMIIDNPNTAEKADNEGDAGSDHSRTRLHDDDDDDDDAQAQDEHDKIPKVLCFSSDSEGEEMDYEFGDGSAYDEPDEEMDQADDGNDEDEDPQHKPVVKVEPESQDVQFLEVVASVEKRRVLVPNRVNSSRESCDSVDSNQGPVQVRRPIFQTKLPLEIEYRYVIDRRRRKQRRKSLIMKQVGPYRVPEFRVDLVSYQQQAVAWMQAREQYPKEQEHQQLLLAQSKRPNRYVRLTDKVCGGILADEMGLGKTVCCIGLICESLKQIREECQRETATTGTSIPRIKPPTLIITPLSILGQWENEIRQKTNLSVITYHGSSRKTYRTAMEFMGADIVLSTYDTLRLKECKISPSSSNKNSDDDNDSNGPSAEEQSEWRAILRNTAEDRRSFVGSKLHQISWHRIILDESHLITNASCARARAAYSLQSKRRWCVTGTPIQNSSSDLASLVGFVGITHKTEAELNEILPHIMLRRLKTTVDSQSHEPILALPEKKEEQIELLFANELEEVFYMLLHRSTKKQVMQYLQAKDAQPQFMHVFELLLRLRQTCNSFALVTQDPITEIQGKGTMLLPEAGAAMMTPGSNNTRLVQRVEARYANSQQQSTSAVLPKSTKLCALLTHLKAVKAKNERALVISQWTGFLDLIAESLESHNVAANGQETISFGKLDGRMAAKEREQVIAWFQQDKRLDVLLISLRTGGMGLNLTMASHVFIMEPSWNPSVESQAIDRVHRFGQLRPVRVVRFIMKNTIEERVVELQRKKRVLAATLLGDTSAAAIATEESRLTRAELRQLFTQGSPDEW